MKNEITLEIKSSNPVDFNSKKEALKKIAYQDTDLIETLAQFSTSLKDVDALTLQRLKKLVESPKALQKLNEKWGVISLAIL